MRVIFDFGHPAHVHYFRNLIVFLKKRGDDILIVARNKDVSFELLKNYNLDFISRGKGANGLLGKAFYLIKTTYFLLKTTKNFKPDLFISFNSPYLSIISKFKGINHLCFNDTEHAKIGNFITTLFGDFIVTPDCFLIDYKTNHIKFNSYMELAYLHPQNFSPDFSVLDNLNIKDNEKYIILRFVSWQAAHDFGHKGLSLKNKLKLINSLEKYAKIFISSESKLPSELLKYRIKIKANKIHSLIKFSSLYIGEGATMASESAMLGTPAIYINDLDAGTLIDQSSKGLIFHYKNFSEDIIEKSKFLITNKETIALYSNDHKRMLAQKINPTKFMTHLVDRFSKKNEISA